MKLQGISFNKVKRQMGCHSCEVVMPKDSLYLKVELSTNRKNYCEECYREWLFENKDYFE